MIVVGAAAAVVGATALEALLELVSGACEDGCCCAVDAGGVDVEEGCACAVEEVGAALVAAACDVGVSDVVGDGAAAAGEVFAGAETLPWRGKMFCAGE